MTEEYADLEARLKRAFAEYDTLKERSAARVTRWEWTEGERYDLRPAFFARNTMTPGEVLVGEPEDKGEKWQYGLDAEGRIAVARHYGPRLPSFPSGWKPPQVGPETFFFHRAGLSVAVRYYQGIPRLIADLKSSEGKPQRYREFYASAKVETASTKADLAEKTLALARETNNLYMLTETYTFEAERLVKVATIMQGSREMQYEEHLAYDAGGLCKVTLHRANGTTQTTYERPAAADDFEALAARVEARLIQMIPQTLRAAKIEEPVYCVVLDHRSRLFPPNLAVGRAADRDTLLATYGVAARYVLFMPAKPLVAITDPDGAGNYERLEQEVWRLERRDEGLAVLDRVAAALNKLDWTSILNVTPEFVALTTDFERDSIADRIAACAPAERVAAIRAKGWL